MMSTAEQPADARIVSAQANVIPRANGKAPKDRHRASVACGACRERRIKCVVNQGESECEQCKRSGLACVIRYDDERRRPISKAYVNSLTERISVLESLLRKNGIMPPPASLPIKYRTGNVADPFDQPLNGSTERSSADQEDADQREQSLSGNETSNRRSSAQDSPPLASPNSETTLVEKLLSNQAHFRYDALSGQFRYFGPTRNYHIYSEFLLQDSKADQLNGKNDVVDYILQNLAADTIDYLESLFWQNYNSVLHVVHNEAFDEDRRTGGTRYYSKYLHLCILAMGFRFCDRSRPDMNQLALSENNRSSVLSIQSRQLLDNELDKPAGLPLIQALLLLGDFECAVGRDSVGWLYAGMANRLCFEIGLHLEARAGELSELEMQIRHMTLWACIVYDKYWAIFLGRPTNMKSSDLEVYHLSKQFERLGPCLPSGPEKTLETQIYEALLELMEIAGNITEMDVSGFERSQATIDRAYQRMSALDRQLNSWYSRLPEPLKWKPENIATAPSSLFLLHQQYHSNLILLHRPFALYSESQSPTTQRDLGAPESKIPATSRRVSTRHAIQIARIFWQHRQKFDHRKVFVTGMQHAGTASVALISALATISQPASRESNMQYLDLLYTSLSEMSFIYQPAEKMAQMLQTVMEELRVRPLSGPSLRFDGLFNGDSVVPTRRSSRSDDEDKEQQQSNKRKQSYTAQPTDVPIAEEREIQSHSIYHQQAYSSQLSGHDQRTTPASRTSYVIPPPSGDLWPSLSADVSYLDHPLVNTRGFQPPMQGWISSNAFAASPSTTMGQSQQYAEHRGSVDGGSQRQPLDYYELFRDPNAQSMEFPPMSTATNSQEQQPQQQPQRSLSGHQVPTLNSMYTPSRTPGPGPPPPPPPLAMNNMSDQSHAQQSGGGYGAAQDGMGAHYGAYWGKSSGSRTG